MYDNSNDSSVIIPDYLLDSSIGGHNDIDSGLEESQNTDEFTTGTESSEDENSLLDNGYNENVGVSSVDYSGYFESIDSHLERLILNQEVIDSKLQNVSDNCFRLYYFIGGLYVVLFIVLAIKFFKQLF